VQPQMSSVAWPRVSAGALRDPIQFILFPAQLSHEKTVTYSLFVVDVRPNKEEVNRLRLTVGRNLIKYDGNVSTSSVDLITSKCYSVISTAGAKYMCLDVKKVYLGTRKEAFEYVRIPIKLIPLEIITQYALLPLASGVHI
jgi:hypothetical protein